MIKREITPPKLNLTRDPYQPPLRVDMEAFFDFSFWLAEELQDLIALHRPAQHDPHYDIPFPDDMQTEWSVGDFGD